MPFCPRCRCEYNVGVEQCVDCKIPVVLRRPTTRGIFDVDLDDLLVPGGAVVCFFGALVLIGLRQAALAGQVGEPLGSMVANQPVCLTAFYVIVAAMSMLVLAISVIRWITGRR